MKGKFNFEEHRDIFIMHVIITTAWDCMLYTSALLFHFLSIILAEVDTLAVLSSHIFYNATVTHLSVFRPAYFERLPDFEIRWENVNKRSQRVRLTLWTLGKHRQTLKAKTACFCACIQMIYLTNVRESSSMYADERSEYVVHMVTKRYEHVWRALQTPTDAFN